MSGEALRVLCLAAGEKVFAVDIMAVREILRRPRLTGVPGAPPAVAGVVNLRGELVEAIDLHQAVVGERSKGSAAEQRLVVARAGDRRLGILVDQVLEVVTVRLEDLMPAPGAEGGGPVTGVFRGMLGEEDTVVLLVRPAVVRRWIGVDRAGGDR